MTLTTASAAALTIGLASPALAMASAAGNLGAAHYQAFETHHQTVANTGAQFRVLPKGDDDDDDGDDDGGGGGGSADIGSHGGSRHHGGLCGIGGHVGGLAHGCGEEGGEDDDDDGHGGDFASEDNGCCGGGAHRVKHVTVHQMAPRVIHRREVTVVPRGAVRTGFGGSQGMNAPLGVAGLSLMLGGAGLLPLARRRTRASGRS
jgi:hypothetical protein